MDSSVRQSQPHYWLCTTSELNFESDKKRGFDVTGFTERNRNIVSRFKPGDRIVYYINGISKIGAIIEVIGEYYRSEEKVWVETDEKWPSRARTKPILVLDKEHMLDVRTIKDHLSFVPKSSGWGMAFRGSIRNLPEEDFFFIESEMKKNQMSGGAIKADDRKPEAINARAMTEEEASKRIMELNLQTKSLHDRLGEMLETIGARMGYNASTRYPVTPEHSYQLDVAWLRGKSPEVAIEVQIGGNITEAKERLTQAKKFNYRKVIIVIQQEQLRELNKIIRFDELRNWLDAWSISSVYQMYQAEEQFFNYYHKLEESRYVEKKEIELI